MHSSISSFDRPLPNLPWILILGLALLIFVIFVSLMEVRLAQLGYVPTVLDSKERWAKERHRVDQLGNRALVLIGASRIQLGIDLDTLRKETQLEPIQLALDGSSFIPPLKSLAADPAMSGTVLIGYDPGSVEGALADDHGTATTFVKAYQKELDNPAFITLAQAEKFLSRNIQEGLRSYADGATPLNSLLLRIIPNDRATKYLITISDRSRLADYKLVSMPGFYYSRVARNLGEERSINIEDSNIEQVLRRKIGLLQSRDASAFVQGARYLRQLVAEIEAHGGRVFFVEMPTSGMVKEIDDKRYPRAKFMDIFEKEVGIRPLTSTDNPALGSFVCPDGSHLDFRDRAKFTSIMVKSLGLSRQK